MSDPLVSILTPSFNQARWLPDNLRSVSAQSYPKIEHIVMDGGSTDGSVGVLEAWGGTNLRWRSEPDQGQSDAINKAFAESHGEIIGWLNSDDAYFSPESVALAVDAFRRHPEADVAYGHAVLVNEDGLVLQVIWAPPMNRRILPIHNFIIQPTAFIRRRALEDWLVDSRMQSVMDRELWLRLSAGHRFVRLNRVVAIDRQQPDRKSAVRPDLVSADQRILDAIYHRPTGPWVRPLRKLLKIAFRVRGLARIREVVDADLAYSGRVDGIMRLALRQVAFPRSWMPRGTT